MSDPSVNHLTFDSKCTYRIRVRGQISPIWADRLGGMTVCPESHECGLAITMLQGELLDQAALAGVLNTLYELHLPVLSVELLSSGQTGARSSLC